MFERKYNVSAGDKFGKLTVIGCHREKNRNKRGTTLYIDCLCECGGNRSTTVASLIYGRTISCGCAQREKLIERNTKHGDRKTRLYRVWKAMKDRCYREGYQYYKSYGGRGISVCDEWRDSFEAFRDWALANGYRDDLSIDRKDNDGNYCPENCRWATDTQQANNRSNSKHIVVDGESLTIAEASRKLGVKYSTLYARKTEE